MLAEGREHISPDALAVLRDARAEGNRVYLPPAQLPRPLYEEVNEVLERLGGKWKGGKVRAHEFPYDPAPLLSGVIATILMPPKNPLAYFATPPDVVSRMLTTVTVATQLPTDAWILEPSAGTGNIVTAIRALGIAARIDAVEPDPLRAAILRAEYGPATAGRESVNVYEADFLTWDAPRRYDAIYMNPPFATPDDRRAYVAHIRRAYGLLKPGGALVSVAPVALEFLISPRSVRELREAITARGGLARLADGAFKDSGTNTACVLAWWVAEGEPLPYVATAAPHIETWQRELDTARVTALDARQDKRTVAELMAEIRKAQKESARAYRELERVMGPLLKPAPDAAAQLALPLEMEPTP